MYSHPSLQHYEQSKHVDLALGQLYNQTFISNYLSLWGALSVSIRMVQVHGLDDLLDCLAAGSASHITCLGTSAEAHEITPCQDQHLEQPLCCFM